MFSKIGDFKYFAKFIDIHMSGVSFFRFEVKNFI